MKRIVQIVSSDSIVNGGDYFTVMDEELLEEIKRLTEPYPFHLDLVRHSMTEADLDELYERIPSRKDRVEDICPRISICERW